MTTIHVLAEAPGGSLEQRRVAGLHLIAPLLALALEALGLWSGDLVKPIALTGVVCAGIATVISTLFQRVRLAGVFAAAAGFIGFVGTLAVLYGAQIRLWPAMSLGLTIWSAAFFLTADDRPAQALMASRGWGRTFRRLVGVALLAPVSIGALCVAGMQRGLFDAPFALAFLGAATALTLVATTVVYTTRLHGTESLYRTMVETGSDGVFTSDTEARYTFVNARFAEMLGRTPDELLGLVGTTLLHPEDRSAVEQRFKLRRNNGLPRSSHELRFLRRDGTTLTAIVTTTTLTTASGRFAGVMGTITDISERAAAEGALRRSEARFRSLYESNVVGVCFWTDGAAISAANEQFLSTFGTRLNAATLPHIPAASVPLLAELAAELHETGRCAPRQREHVREDGTRVAVLTTAALVDPESGEAVCFALDVTQQRELQRVEQVLRTRVNVAGAATAEDLAERLAASNAELETFTYSVSHDLRAPLRGIAGFSRELLLDYGGSFDERGRRYLDRICAATERMGAIIDDLLDFSRSARSTLQRRRVDVTRLAREVAAEAVDRTRGRIVVFDVEDGLRADADERLLRIALENLVANAVKFTTPRDEARITISSAALGGRPAISVRDNGVGFDPLFADKLFAPFFRMHASEFEGNGIGLAIVQRIVQRHGGSIAAEGTPGEGAAFTFALGQTA